MRVLKPYLLGKRLFVRLGDADAGFGLRFTRFVRSTALCGLVTASGYGCASEAPIERPVVKAVAELGGHWEVDYARSDTVQTQINASFREVQREIRRRQEAVESGASPQGMPLGDADTLIALAKMAELVTDSDLLEIEQDPHILRVQRANNFALSCDLDEAQVVHSLLGAERCWWDGQQWHFLVRLPNGLSIEHRFSVSEDSRSLAQRTVLAAPGVNRDLEVVRIYSRYDPSTRGFRCIDTLSRGRVCTTENSDISHDY